MGMVGITSETIKEWLYLAWLDLLNYVLTVGQGQDFPCHDIAAGHAFGVRERSPFWFAL